MMTKPNKHLVRLAALALALLLLLTLVVPALAAGEEDTITIKNADDLLSFSRSCTLDTWSHGKTVVLQADISLDGVDFLPIPTFGGTFDGRGHTISGLTITGNAAPAGLFGILQETAVVQDLNVSGTVDPAGDADAVGGIAGENNGVISNCSFTGNVSGASSTGGIAGINAVTGTIRNCRTSGAVFGENMTGGIAGCNLGSIDSCQNSAYVNITSIDPSISLEDISFDFVWDISKITSLDTSTASSDTGGIAGYSSGVIQNCANHSTVGYQHVGYNVGGVAGRSCGYILACTNEAEVYGRKDVGGIAGQMEPYIAANLSEDTLTKLRQQLDELNGMVNGALNDVDSGVGTATARLNRIADYLDSASGAVGNISAYGSIDSVVVGGGEHGGGGSVTVTPPQIEVSGSGVTGSGVDVTITPSSGSGAGVSFAEGELQGGLTEGSVTGAGGSSASGRVDASTQLMLNTSLHGLSSAVNGMSGQMRLLSGELGHTSGTLTDDLRAINNQITAIADTLFDGMWGSGQGDTLTDTSEVEIDQVTLGKAASCKNSGTVYGDINVGGVTGVMAIEYELDPEDDVTANLTGTQRRKYELKAILQSCVNTGEVTAKRSYAGGVCGRMDLGLILLCENYGGVESENGDYIGGIAGATGGTVRNCFAKCSLEGGRYVGGIVGSGTAEENGSSSSTVSGCYSLVSIDRYEQYVGAVSGSNTGTFLENYFVSDTLAGINRMSYSGQAEPIAYADLPWGSASEETAAITMPDAFRTLMLRFVADDATIKAVSFDYGQSFDKDVYPELPEKEGYYAYWDRTDLQNLRFDTVVTAVYERYASALSSTETRSSGRPIFFTEGQFDEEAALTVTAQANTPADFDLVTDFKDFASKCFSGAKVSREIVEQWSIDIPEDGLDTHTVRYLPPDGDPENLDIYVRENGGWQKAETQAVGSYLTFPVSGSHAEIAVLSTMPVWWVWLIVAALLVLVLILILRLVRRVRKAKKPDPEEDPAGEEEYLYAYAGTAAGSSAPADHVDNGEEDPSVYTYPTPPGVRVPPPPPDTTQRKKKRWLPPLVIILAVLCVLVGIAAAPHIMELKDGVEAYSLLRKYTQQEELTMELSVQAELGGQAVEFSAQVDRTQAEGRRVTCIAQDEMRLYYADGVVFLENGHAYQLTDAFPDYSQLLMLALPLYQHADITVTESGDQSTYRITAEQADARELLEILLPSAAADLSGMDTVTVELTADDGDVSELRFFSSGTLNDSGRTPFSVSAVLRTQQREPIGIPQNVRAAIRDGDYEAIDTLTGDLLRLAAAWQELNERDPLSAQINLRADCGPLILRDDLELDRWTLDGGQQISCIRKNGRALYFTDSFICGENGEPVSETDADTVDAVQLLEIAYLLCMSADLDYTVSGSESTYSLSLDEKGMEAVVHAIAPATEEMDLLFDTGALVIVVRDDVIESIRVSCTGDVQIVLSHVAAAFEAEVRFTDEASDLSVPDAVRQALA